MDAFFINKIELFQFKNHHHTHLNFESDIVLIEGKNGVGKSNLLDAIHYLCMCKSFLQNKDSANIMDNCDDFLIKGVVNGPTAKEVEIQLGFKKGLKKTLRVGGKKYPTIARHIGKYPIVVISPNDHHLIYDGAESRRKWLNGLIAQLDSNYLKELIQYNKVLSNRSALLQNFLSKGFFEMEQLAFYNEKMLALAPSIYSKRKAFMEDFKKYFQEAYNIISPKNEKVELIYSSDLFEKEYSDLLKKSLVIDRQSGRNNVGVHRDDVLFKMNGRPLKRFASQGQQKSFLFALKLAQYRQLNSYNASKAIFLIDDLTDRLDGDRLEAMINLVCSDSFGQVFITDTGVNDILKRIADASGKSTQVIQIP